MTTYWAQLRLASKPGNSTAEQMNPFVKLSQALARAMAMLLPNCRQASRLQSQALLGKLSILPRLGLWAHLAFCKWCRRYGKQIRLLGDARHRSRAGFAERSRANLSDTARERIKRRLNAEEG